MGNHFPCLLVSLVEFIHRMPGGVIVGDSGLSLSCVPVQCATYVNCLSTITSHCLLMLMLQCSGSSYNWQGPPQAIPSMQNLALLTERAKLILVLAQPQHSARLINFGSKVLKW